MQQSHETDKFHIVRTAEIIPVILSGGAGTRLWPLSRPDRPKQFLDIIDEKTMLQNTFDRLRFIPGLGTPVVVTGASHTHLVDLDLAGTQYRVVIEPFPRNTAPAVAAAALALRKDPVLLVLPSDHTIGNVSAFKTAVLNAADCASEGKLVTFGIVPTSFETGYGYIHVGHPSGNTAFSVQEFVEKPDLATAEEYVASGQYLWNSGMFAFRASRYLAELALFAPNIAAATESAVGGRSLDDRLHLDPKSFSACPSDSIDFAVMENTSDAVVIPLDAGWNDVGSWSAVGDISHRDKDGNATRGTVRMSETHNSVIWSEERLIAAVGIDNLVIVETNDAILVANKHRSQEIKTLVEKLRNEGRAETLSQSHEIRPWGSFEILASGKQYQVKRLIVNPGAKLSLQSHQHRAEEWTVTEGTAHVMLEDEEINVEEGSTISVPLGARHRLHNPGIVPLIVIEVQLGSYLGEDDIVRYDDVYGRS